ncbi:MAG: hypothetical protein FD164_1682 [Nitrospirae bacterium]|nr:MAG: hypothetical protein FD164_1682 [Nitrospirota bacterium]
MKTVLMLLLTLIFYSGSHAAGIKAAGTSTAEDQTTVSITIYNSNIGLVKDQRTVRLAKGTSTLRFMDVAEQVMPATVHMKSLTNPDGLRILEQNYEYDLLNPQKLLDKYVGKDVKLYQKNPYSDKEEIVRARLLSNNSGAIYQIGDEITFGHPGRVIFPGVPDTLIAKPTLLWLLANSGVSEQKIETSYLTNGITWRADYVITLNDRDDRSDISGWVTIDNKSGGSYQNANVKLVAGDVNRVKDDAEYTRKMYRAATDAAPAQQFREESLFEYHLYTLLRPSTIKQNQTKQISFVTADEIPVKKELVLRGDQSYYWNQISDTSQKQKIGVYLEIANRKENNLGMPLPKGIIRAYKKDREGSLQFIGEDRIDHTPKDEKILIKLGDAFDVVASRKQTDWKKIANNIYEASSLLSG